MFCNLVCYKLSFFVYRVFHCKDNTHNRQHTTDTVHKYRQHTVPTTTNSTHNNTTHMHSLPLPTSVVFLTILVRWLIAQDFDACLASILALRWRPFPTSPSWSEVVWQGRPLPIQFWKTVVGSFCWTSARRTPCRVERRSLSSPRSCAKTVVPMWSGCWASSAWICLLSHVSSVIELPEPTVARSVFRA